MKNLKNANGMSLVAVMFIIVLFSVVGITLMSLTTTNAKQIQKVEQDMQAVDIAEMGIVKYRNELIIHINDKLKIKINNALYKIIKNNNKFSNNPKKQIEINGKNIIEQMGDLDTNALFLLNIDPKKRFEIDKAKNVYYTIKQERLSGLDSDNIIEINYLSTGYSTGKSSTIKGTFTIDLEELIESSLRLGNADNGSSVITDPFPEYSGKISKKCTNTSPIINECQHTNGAIIDSNISDSTAIIDKSFSFTSNNEIKDSHLLVNGNGNVSKIKELENSTLYFSGSATFGQVSNSNMSNSKIYAKGNISTGSFNVNEFNNMEMFSGGNIKFWNTNFDLKNSTIHAKGSMTMKNFNNAIVNSKIFVDRNLEIKNGPARIDKDSLICVGGKIIGKLKENGINVITKANYPEVFAEKCPPIDTNNDVSSIDSLIPGILDFMDESNYKYQ